MDLLAKARLLYHLFKEEGGGGGGADDAPDGAGRRRPRHSVFPVQPSDPSLCPYEARPDHDPSDIATFSAVLLLLAPVHPSLLRRLYPHILLLNGGGVGGEAREVAAHPIALRMLLSGSHDAAASSSVAPWVALPASYSPHLALAALSRLGGPPIVALRHPHATKFAAAGGGLLVVESDDLDAALACLLLPPASDELRSRAVPRRVAALAEASRFWPDGEGGDGRGAAAILLEAHVASHPMPHDGARKGYFDVTHRAYAVWPQPRSAAARAAARVG